MFKAHRWLYHSTLGSRVIKKTKKKHPGYSPFPPSKRSDPLPYLRGREWNSSFGKCKKREQQSHPEFVRLVKATLALF